VEPPTYLIIGPSRAGKTGLLATLRLAALDPEASHDGLRVRLSHENEQMRKLSESALRTVREGTLPVSASSGLEQFAFRLEVQHRRLPFSFVTPNVSRADFTFWDGPGGSLFPTPEEQSVDFDETAHKTFRGELVEAMKRARGVVLCFDCMDEERSLVLFESLPVIFSDTGLSDLPASRICICLTKVDAKYAHLGAGAHAAAEQASALEACRELLPRVSFGVLQNYCPDAEFAFGWTSVYGFLPTGAPNYDPVGKRMARFHGDGQGAKAMDDWRPFRVLDPFVWLVGGHRRDLEVVRARDLL
jgi:GTPase SAR1 family protein